MSDETTDPARPPRVGRPDLGAGGLPCASCGLLPTGPGFVVYGKPEGLKTCASCGRPLHFVIEVSGPGTDREPGPGVLTWP
jgi:hypothetical protein